MLLMVAFAFAVTLHRVHRRVTAVPGVRGALCLGLDALVALGWWALIAWIVMQPMQMRGLLS
jgi:hypothetical protein